MTQEEFNNQRNRFGRFVTFNDQLYIGPLNYEMNALEWMWRHSQQQQTSLEKKLFESCAENRNLRERIKTLLEKMGSPPGSQPATNESPPPLITRLPNTNAYGETWDDVLSSLNQYSNVTKSVEQVSCSQQSDVAHESSDPVGQQVVREQVVTEQVSTKSLVFVSLLIFAAFNFLNIALSTIALSRTTIAHQHYHILTITFYLNMLYILFP